MSRKAKNKQVPKRLASFLTCLRNYFTPAVWKQAQQLQKKTARKKKRPAQERWTLPALVHVVLALCWLPGRSLAERFEGARAFYVASHPKRARPGKTYAGFQKAFGRLPTGVWRFLTGAVRQQLPKTFGKAFEFHGFVPLGVDGSRLSCSYVGGLLRRLGVGSNKDTNPQVWLTAVVHLTLGFVYSWRCGKGNASEREHLRHLVRDLPKNVLLVTDAGYTGYEVVRHLNSNNLAFLMRLSSTVTLYTAAHTPMTKWKQGVVYWWTDEARQAGLPPLKLRLICVKSSRQKHAVWLVTNVLESTRLSRGMAAQLYRWRWENEGQFRNYKEQWGKRKLQCQTVRQVHREVEASVLSMQLAQICATRSSLRRGGRQPSKSSSAQALRIVRECLNDCWSLGARRSHQEVGKLFARTGRENRPGRPSAKVKEPWPTREKHQPPKPPKIRRLNGDYPQQKDEIFRHFQAL